MSGTLIPRDVPAQNALSTLPGGGDGPIYRAGRFLGDNWDEISSVATQPEAIVGASGMLLVCLLATGFGVRTASYAARALSRLSSARGYGQIVVGKRRMNLLDRLTDKQLILKFNDRLLHSTVLGPTGSGKTSLLTPMLSQDLEAGHTVFVLEIFGDLGTKAISVARSSGAPIYRFDLSFSGSLRYDPLSGDDDETIANRAAEVVRSLVSDVPYYQFTAEDTTRNYVLLARAFARHTGARADMALVHRLLRDEEFLREVLGHVSSDRKGEFTLAAPFLDTLLGSWFIQHLSRAPHHRDHDLAGVRGHFSTLFSNRALREALCPADDDRVLDLEQALATPGALVVCRLPPASTGGAAQPSKMVVQWILQRFMTYINSREDRLNPICAFVDEAHTILSSSVKEASQKFDDFLTLARKQRCAVHLAYQSPSLLSDSLVNVLASNGGNMFVAGGLRGPDAEYVQGLLGKMYAAVEDERRTRGRHGGWTTSRGRRYQEVPRITTEQVSSRPVGSWTVQLKRNRSLDEPVEMRALPTRAGITSLLLRASRKHFGRFLSPMPPRRPSRNPVDVPVQSIREEANTSSENVRGATPRTVDHSTTNSESTSTGGQR